MKYLWNFDFVNQIEFCEWEYSLHYIFLFAWNVPFYKLVKMIYLNFVSWRDGIKGLIDWLIEIFILIVDLHFIDLFFPFFIGCWGIDKLVDKSSLWRVYFFVPAGRLRYAYNNTNDTWGTFNLVLIISVPNSH